MSISGNVLLVDDEPSLRQVLTRVLRQSGCEVTAAGDGKEALRRLEMASYDLVYLDIHLPEMTGLQVLEKIHASYPELPVVLFTAFASINSVLQALRLGATDYLIKPIDPDILIARTRVILEDQAVERRRKEIQIQIDALQDELKSLEKSTQGPPAPAPMGGDRFLKRGTFVLDFHARRATLGERIISPAPTTFDYLSVMLRHAPDVVPYLKLVNEAQGYEADSLQARELAKWHIFELRKLIEPEPQKPRYLLNVRGVGYRLVLD